MSKSKFYTLIYEDEQILVVNKSPGIPVVPSRDPNEKSLVKLLQHHYDQHIYVVHRIDRETSGIVIFALDEASHKLLNVQFYKRSVEKHYLAICSGVSSSDWTRVDKSLAMDRNTNRMKVDQRGKEALSYYKSLESSNRYSKNIIKIETGRTHQVRIHLSSEGYPILGDSLYNFNPYLKLSDIKKKYVASGKDKVERPLMPRTALHAFSLQFEHPTKQERMTFEADLPKDMKACWKQIMKWDTN